MAEDNISLLPKMPPPRPAARDAAIGAAMRRFDGVEPAAAAPVRPAPRWSWGRNPHYSLALSMSVIAIIGLPAAWVAMRDVQRVPERAVERQDPRPSMEAAPSPAVDATPEATGDAATPPGPVQPRARPEPDRLPVLPDDAPSGTFARKAETAPNAVAAGAAPPPPPPAPAAEPETDDLADQSVVVTGSRIARANAWAERQRDGRGKMTSSTPLSNERSSAPDWVLRDGAYRSFLARLQAAVRSNDRGAVLALASFPLRVNYPDGPKYYRDARTAVVDYDRIFTPAVRAAILGQKFERLFGRDQGVMIGDGAVWFDHVCRNSACSPAGPVKIRAVNP